MDVRFQVRRYYGDRITKNQGCCSPQVETRRAGALEVPSFGCGAPTEFADLKPGETVLDLSSGAGLDCFRAAEAVGETGRVVGVDMTPEMLARARQGAAQLGLENVTFREGYIEVLPLETASVDAVISNCVVNLSDDKAAVLAEAYRVLKPGGRVALSDIVRAGEAPAGVSEKGWCACEDGAEDAETYRRRLAAAGFVDISVAGDAPPAGVYSAHIQATKPVIRAATADDLDAVRDMLTTSGLPLAGLEQTALWVLATPGVKGVVGYERYDEAALLRSLAVVPESRGRGYAGALLTQLWPRLADTDITTVYALTTTIPNWLLHLGFEEITRAALPDALAASEQLRGACPGSARVFRKALS